MRAFAALYEGLDNTTSTNEKVDLMMAYFTSTPPEDAVWGLFFLTGRRLKRLIHTRIMQDWTTEITGLPSWILADCWGAVGDLAETVALLLDGQFEPTSTADLPLHRWLSDRIQPLGKMDEARQKKEIVSWWAELERWELFVLTKLLTGAFRVGVSQTLVMKALARSSGLSRDVIAHRLMGTWNATPEFFQALMDPNTSDADISRPYPFYLASPLDRDPEDLGARTDWLVEWKWDGIRAQIVRREGQTFIWSRGEDLVTDRFPEILRDSRILPDGTVLDGELLAYDGGPLPFAVLQRRIGRKQVSPKILVDAPVSFVCYDLLELDGKDVREKPMDFRRANMLDLVQDRTSRLLVSKEVKEETWDDLEALRLASRDHQTEGLMLKRRDSPYGSGRKKGDWWKWKVDPFTIDAVLVYAQTGTGKRANLFTDYTFSLWEGTELVQFAKAYSGLDDEEIAEVDRWVRKNTLERYGPVRAVPPHHVFELAFEGIQHSTRHRSGVALRFPRISRWRSDKKPEEANSLDDLKAMIPLLKKRKPKVQSLDRWIQPEEE